jgi:hypothetical protein
MENKSLTTYSGSGGNHANRRTKTKTYNHTDSRSTSSLRRLCPPLPRQLDIEIQQCIRTQILYRHQLRRIPLRHQRERWKQTRQLLRVQEKGKVRRQRQHRFPLLASDSATSASQGKERAISSGSDVEAPSAIRRGCVIGERARLAGRC